MTPDRPNVLWIGVDQMRADTPGFMGGGTCRTPHLDALASESTVFERAYAPSAQCTPSRASMLTGRYAFSHGMGNNADMYHAIARELPHPEQLLTHRFAEMGYRLGYVGKWHVGSELGPHDYGFAGMHLPGYGDPTTYDGYRRYLSANDLSYGPLLEPIYGNEGATLLAGVWNGPTASSPERYLTERTCELIDASTSGDDPFFVTCQYWAPHPPYLPSPEFAGLHDPDELEPWINLHDDLTGKPRALHRFRRDFYRKLPTDWRGWRRLVARYYDYAAMVDAEIGRLLAHLRRRGLEDRTIVAFTSDHGDMTGSHGLFDKGFVYEEAHRVPLLVRWPGRRAAERRRDLATNMDLLPTLLAAIGAPVKGVHGRSLLAGPDGGDAPRDALLLESHGMRQLASRRALVTDSGWKYVFNPSDEDELYDLNDDPGELRNLLHHDPNAARDEPLRRRLVEAMFDSGDPLVEYAAKLFGDWSNRSGQPDASAPLRT